MKANTVVKGLAAMSAAVMVAANAWSAVEWKNIDDEHKLGGRKLSAGYLQGRVVLVCRNPAMAPRMEAIWDSFKTRSFALIGAFNEAVPGVNFSQYRGADLGSGAPEAPVYVVNPLGAVVYGGDSDREASEAVVTAITDWESPRNAKQFKQFLDWEIDNQPGAATIRFAEFKKRFPKDSSIKDYEAKIRELSKLQGMGSLVKLIETSRKVRNYLPKNNVERKRLPSKISSHIRKSSKLKEAADPRVAQEAKNAIADLVWTMKSL